MIREIAIRFPRVGLGRSVLRNLEIAGVGTEVQAGALAVLSESSDEMRPTPGARHSRIGRAGPSG